MSERKFYRTVFQVEVLSEDPLVTDMDLVEIYEAITNGDCSGQIKVVVSEEVDGKKMAELLTAQDSDPGFFMLLDDE